MFSTYCAKRPTRNHIATKANEHISMLEVIATVILRCVDKNTLEDVDLVNLLYFKAPDVGLWKKMEADWALALHQAFPKIWTNINKCSKISCF